MSVLSDILQGTYDTVRVPDRLYSAKKEMDRMSNFAGKNDHKALNLDNYYHPKAMYEQAQKGTLPGRTALLGGYLREGLDIGKNLLGGKGLSYALNESKKDLKNNSLGYKMGREELGTHNSVTSPFLQSIATPTMKALALKAIEGTLK